MRWFLELPLLGPSRDPRHPSPDHPPPTLGRGEPGGVSTRSINDRRGRRKNDVPDYPRRPLRHRPSPGPLPRSVKGEGRTNTEWVGGGGLFRLDSPREGLSGGRPPKTSPLWVVGGGERPDLSFPSPPFPALDPPSDPSPRATRTVTAEDVRRARPVEAGTGVMEGMSELLGEVGRSRTCAGDSLDPPSVLRKSCRRLLINNLWMIHEMAPPLSLCGRPWFSLVPSGLRPTRPCGESPGEFGDEEVLFGVPVSTPRRSIRSCFSLGGFIFDERQSSLKEGRVGVFRVYFKRKTVD